MEAERARRRNPVPEVVHEVIEMDAPLGDGLDDLARLDRARPVDARGADRRQLGVLARLPPPRLGTRPRRAGRATRRGTQLVPGPGGRRRRRRRRRLRSTLPRRRRGRASALPPRRLRPRARRGRGLSRRPRAAGGLLDGLLLRAAPAHLEQVAVARARGRGLPAGMLGADEPLVEGPGAECDVVQLGAAAHEPEEGLGAHAAGGERPRCSRRGSRPAAAPRARVEGLRRRRSLRVLRAGLRGSRLDGLSMVLGDIDAEARNTSRFGDSMLLSTLSRRVMLISSAQHRLVPFTRRRRLGNVETEVTKGL